MGWVVCSDAVVESCDAVLIFVVTASRCIFDAVFSHCREILDQCWCRGLNDPEKVYNMTPHQIPYGNGNGKNGIYGSGDDQGDNEDGGGSGAVGAAAYSTMSALVDAVIGG
ncbi:hypothetical protein Tco_0171873 [Tanacetum coccineum]